MAATTYSSLVSLMNVLTRYQHPTCPVSFDQSKIQTLFDKVNSSIVFLEIYYRDSQTTTKTSRRSIQGLEKKMTSAAHAAEDLIESSYVTRMLARNTDDNEGCMWPVDILNHPDLQKSIQEMDQIIEEAIYFVNSKENTCEKDQSSSANNHVQETRNNHSTSNQPVMQIGEESGSKKRHLAPYSSYQGDPIELTPTPTPMSCPRANNNVVGFEDQFTRLMDRITTHHRSRQIIPIVGMGGMGKTTLARYIYNHTHIGRHFNVRAWVTISQLYSLKDIMLSLLKDMKLGGNNQMDDEQLGDRLHKGLMRIKYLIILDDVWSRQVWDDLRRFFPDNDNKSRILFTTRLHSVAHEVGSTSTYEMEFLNVDNSFNLLSEIVYGKNVFACKLKSLGKKIAKSCKGLPLAIVVVGGLLKASPKTRRYWASVAENVASIISTENDGHCLEILSLSYKHLPIHLRPCFLYMATFKEDETILIPLVIDLWVADGFLKPVTDRTIDQVALEYLSELISRNLIILEKKGENGKVDTCTMHDISREFCLREAQNEKFLCLIGRDTLNIMQRRVAYKYSDNESGHIFPSMPNARSLYVNDSWSYAELHKCCMLRVFYLCLDDGDLSVHRDFMVLVNIRYVQVTSCSGVLDWLLPSLSLLWNLEILEFTDTVGSGGGRFILPPDIWEFTNLRKLRFDLKVALSDPTGAEINCSNLEAFSTEAEFYCTAEVLQLIPNLKELQAHYTDAEVEDPKFSGCFTNLALLPKLEILSVIFNIKSEDNICAMDKLVSLTFPHNLKELRLFGSRIQWANMTVIGSLPNLETLILGKDSVFGEEWNPIEGELQCIKRLTIDHCYLGVWNAESCHFPRLENLHLSFLNLKQIPLGIADIPSLESIQLFTEHISAIISAREILDERRNQGDEDDFLIEGLYYGKSVEEKAELEKWAEVLPNTGGPLLFHYIIR